MSDINELTWPDVMSISFASIEDRKQFEKLFSGWKSATEDAVKRERTAVEAEIANLKAQVKALREALEVAKAKGCGCQSEIGLSGWYSPRYRTIPPDGVPCSHPGCLIHISHPCEGCGRIGGRALTAGESRKEGSE